MVIFRNLLNFSLLGVKSAKIEKNAKKRRFWVKKCSKKAVGTP